VPGVETGIGATAGRGARPTPFAPPALPIHMSIGGTLRLKEISGFARLSATFQFQQLNWEI
jgi:hypothetical protein